MLPLLKTAILLEWLRILAPQGNRLKSPFWWGCVSIIVLQCVWGVACVILLNVQCTPHEAIWKVYMPRDLCFNLVPVQLTSGAVQLFSDVVMLVLPQKTIWNLNLSWQKKLGVSVVFGLGILYVPLNFLSDLVHIPNICLFRACISAAFRISVTVTYGYDLDQMYTLAPVVFWVLAETTCGFFIVCIPCLPKILKDKGIIRKFKQRFGMRATTVGASGPGSGKYGKYGYGSNLDSSVFNHSRSGTTADAYHKLDEEGGVAMGSLETESMERLRRPEDSKGKITRTTQIHVHSDGRPQNGNEIDAPAAGKPIVKRGNDGWYQ